MFGCCNANKDATLHGSTPLGLAHDCSVCQSDFVEAHKERAAEGLAVLPGVPEVRAVVASFLFCALLCFVHMLHFLAASVP